MKNLEEERYARRKAEHYINERVKELTCLYGISEIFREKNLQMEEILLKAVKLLPPAWQFPEITCARIVVDEQEYKTENYKKTKWKQSAKIFVNNEPLGIIDVLYLEEKPTFDEGPFLKQEKDLIEGIASTLGLYIERKKAEDIIREERDKIKQYFEIVGVIVIAISIKEEIILINQKGCEILGYKREEIIGKNYFDIIIPKRFRNDVRDVFQKLITGEIEPVEYFENSIVTKSGEERILAWYNTNIKNKEGKIVATLSSGEDITERMRKEQQIIHLTKVLRAVRNVNQLITKEKDRSKLLQRACNILIENRGYFNAWIALIDDSNKVTHVFEAGIGDDFSPIAKMLKKGKITKCAEKTMLQTGIALIKDPRSICGDCPLVISYGGRAAMIIRLEHKSNVYGWLTVSIPKELIEEEEEHELFEEVANDIAFALYDIDREEKHREAEKKVIKSESLYRMAYDRANFYKDLFAHDMNNILQAILSGLQLSELIFDDPNKLEALKTSLRIMKNQITRGSNLISNVRKLSQLEEIKTPLKKIEICNILKDLIISLKNAFHTKNLNIQVHSIDKKLHVQANDFLVDVFENILNNSVKHNRVSFVEIKIRIFREKKNGINYLKIEFQDNGKGIADTRKEMIFQRGYTKEKNIKGMGLGLSLVKKIIDNYNGDIWVEDRIKGDHSKGSNFILLIPEVK